MLDPWKVIAEAREGGNVGICRETGEVRSDLIEEILTKIPQDKILWRGLKNLNKFGLLNLWEQMLILEISLHMKLFLLNVFGWD